MPTMSGILLSLKQSKLANTILPFIIEVSAEKQSLDL